MAAYHADNGPRDYDDGRGGIIVLDGDAVRRSFRTEAVDDPWWVGEHEEWLNQSLAPLTRYAVGYVWLDDLVPGLGVKAPRLPPGTPYVPAEPIARMQQIASLGHFIATTELPVSVRRHLEETFVTSLRPVLPELKLGLTALPSANTLPRRRDAERIPLPHQIG